MNCGFRNFLKARDGASAVEFAIVVLLFVGILFGAIDFSRMGWIYNLYEKATQAGARVAVVAPIVATKLETYDFSTEKGFGGPYSTGSIVPVNQVYGTAVGEPIVCTWSAGAAACTGNWGPYDSAAFQAIADEMRVIAADLTNEDITVEYQHIGLGFAGNPFGTDVTPAVTVRISGKLFRFITPLALGGTISFSDFTATLTGESFGS